MRRLDLDPGQLDDALERPQILDPDLDAADLQQVLRLSVGHFQVAHADAAAHAQAQGRALLERQRQVGAEQGRLQPHRQALRQVAEPGRDVETIELDLGFAGTALAERRRCGRRIEAAAVEREGQPRLDLDLALRGQRADERHAEGELAHLVRGGHRHIHEIGAAAAHDDVVHRKAGRPVVLLLRCCGQALQHVVDVVAAFVEARQAQHRRVDFETVDHRRKAHQRAQGGVGEDALDLDLRRRTSAGAGQRQVGYRQLERPRIEGDVAEREAPAELLFGRLFQLALEQRRHDQPGRAPQHRQPRDDDAGANQRSTLEEAAHERSQSGASERPIAATMSAVASQPTLSRMKPSPTLSVPQRTRRSAELCTPPKLVASNSNSQELRKR